MCLGRRRPAGLPEEAPTPPGAQDPQLRVGAKPHPMRPSPGGLIFSPELRGSLAPPPTPKFGDSLPPLQPRVRNFGISSRRLPTPGRERRGHRSLFQRPVRNFGNPSPCALSDPDSGTSRPPRPLKPRNFGAPEPPPASLSGTSGTRRALPMVLEPLAPRVPGAGSDSRAHPAGSAPRECPGASRVLPRAADSPQPGAPLACWLRGPRPPRLPPHRPRLCLRLRRRPRRLRSHRGRSRRGRRPPRLPGLPRPPRSAPCRPSVVAGAASAVPRSLVIFPAIKICQGPAQQSSQEQGEPGDCT
ncbi:serine/arginine repetitive matrix protein 1-like [Lutra lutra]|uniref:serine/arginine repetitive matrix protein 1-like n=1 Tax=Lutra lutra TaxID=9657 RepID=UPI001FCF9765|nr:serine/arginine repetitive matrix protein 1-like [Lutra lutra]